MLITFPLTLSAGAVQGIARTSRTRSRRAPRHSRGRGGCACLPRARCAPAPPVSPRLGRRMSLCSSRAAAVRRLHATPPPWIEGHERHEDGE
eukprot:6149020-Pleurochrysis_carterae.AAC.1